MKYFSLIIAITVFQIQCKSQSQPSSNIQQNISTPPLQAEIKYVFVDGENEGKYMGGITMKEGFIKLNQNYLLTDDNGHQKIMTVLEIENYKTNDKSASTLHGGEEGFVVLRTIDGKKWNELSGAIYFGDKKPESMSVITQPSELTCTIDKAAWSANIGYKTAQYFPNGNDFFKSKESIFIITFNSTESDKRNFVIQAKSFKPIVANHSKANIEFALMGSPNGDKNNSCIQSNWKNGQANTVHTPFTFYITKWEDMGDHAILSGTFSGTLYGFNMLGIKCPDVTISDGIIKDVKVEIQR
jgi:hypothetical protein